MLTPDEIETRRELLILSELPLPKTWWYMSFADPDLPKGSQFLGGAIVKAQGVATAHIEVNRLGINPGGEVMFMQVPPDVQVNEDYVNRLLTREEVESDALRTN